MASYIHINIGNRCFSIHQAWIELLVYGTSYYLIHSFIFKFLIKYSIDPDNSNKNNSNNTTKDFKKNNNAKNTKTTLNIIRGGDESINNKILAEIIKRCFEKDVSYKITHPDLVEKIRKFIKAPNQGIKIVPLSVAVIAIIHPNQSHQIVKFGIVKVILENRQEFKTALINSAVKATIMAGVSLSPAGRVILLLLDNRALKPIIGRLPTAIAGRILKQKILRLILEGLLIAAPVAPQIGTAIQSIPAVQTQIACLRINCSDFIEELSADDYQENIKYVDSYQKPDTRVIIKGSSDHIICIPEKSIIKRTMTTIPTLDGDIVVGEKCRVKKKIIAHESYEVPYKIYNDPIPETRDFNEIIHVSTQEKAKEILADANLLNEDDFEMSPKAKEGPIKIKNN